MNGTCAAFTTGTIASDTGLSIPPNRMAQPSLSISSRAAVWPLAGFDSSSRRTSSSIRPPSTPPLALISSIAMVRPRVIPSPDLADCPDSAATKPILTGSAAKAGRPMRLPKARPAGMARAWRRVRLVGMSDTPRSKVHLEEAFEVQARQPRISRCGHGLKGRRADQGDHDAPLHAVVTSDGADDAFDQIVGVLQRRIIEAGVLAGDHLAGVALDFAGEDRLARLGV